MTDAILTLLQPMKHLLWPGKCFQKAKFGSTGSLPAGWEVTLYLLRNSTLFPTIWKLLGILHSFFR